MIKAWTDYPLAKSDGRGICDSRGYSLAPIRRVELIGWDGNKYCMIKYRNKFYSLKLCYIYSAPGRLLEVPCIINTVEVPEISICRYAICV